MATKKKTKKRTSKRRVSGIAGYTRKINSSPAVKKANAKVKKLESDLKAAKRQKASAKKAAQKKYRSGK